MLIAGLLLAGGCFIFYKAAEDIGIISQNAGKRYENVKITPAVEPKETGNVDNTPVTDEKQTDKKSIDEKPTDEKPTDARPTDGKLADNTANSLTGAFDHPTVEPAITDATITENSTQNIIDETPDDSAAYNTTTDSVVVNKDTEQDGAVTATGQEVSQMFYYEEINQEIKDRITGKSYGENCDVSYGDLRYVKVLYLGFDGETHDGELIVNKAIAKDIIDIFEELYEQKYPIERMVLVDEYDADDNVSMAADNTSAFNYRVVDGTNRLSVHSYGLAIDINPFYNPYVREMDGKTVVTPVNGAKYADRSLDCKYYIKKDDICYKAFISRGFTWGGEWKTQKDYQHFQKKLD